jgi:adenylate cyclase
LAVGAAFILSFFISGITVRKIILESFGNVLFLFAGTLSLDAVRLIGRFPIEKLVLGKYHRPKEEERIFLFIDLKESTKLSLDLGKINFSYLIKEFFKDIDWAARKWKGEIYQYAGDQVIISWLVKDQSTFLAAANTYLSFHKRMMAKRSFYRERFGAAPSFKAALHEGNVITTWVGHSKREIVYQGDVLNLTARLTDLAKNLNYPIIMSENVASQIASHFADSIIHGGNYAVKGVEEPVSVYFFVFKKTAVEKSQDEKAYLMALA